MKHTKLFGICLVSLIIILISFSSIGTAAGDTPPYNTYLPVASKMLLENPPVAVNDTYITNTDTQLVVSAPGVLENDSDVDGDALTAVLVGDPAHGNLALNENGSFTYTPDSGYEGSDNFTYKASDGELESNRATGTLAINALAPSCSTAPTLISPSNGSNPDTLIPTFQWDNGNVADITEVSLLIMLHEDDFPDHWEYWVTSYNSSFNEERYDEMNLPPATTYYWKVWLRCGEIESPHSEVWSFTTGSGGTILPAPTLLSPPNESEFSSGDLPVILQWAAVTGAEEYKVVISKWTDATWYIDWSTTVTGTELIIPYRLTVNTYYRWRVRPINYYALGTISEPWTFKTQY